MTWMRVFLSPHFPVIKFDDHNEVQDIVKQEDDAGLEHENMQLTREQEQHNRI
jgi:hypothetical protein